MTIQLMDMSDSPISTEISAHLDQDKALRHDDSSFKIETAIVSTEYNHRLLAIVSTDSYQHIVDPACKLLSLARIPEVHCEHKSPRGRSGELYAQFQTLDIILGTWDLDPNVERDSVSPEGQDPSPLHTYTTSIPNSIAFLVSALLDVLCQTPMAAWTVQPKQRKRLILGFLGE